ncbi:MAG: PEP-CTERM sorting domain-containing protein [Akkermansiaceae bacterium]
MKLPTLFLLSLALATVQSNAAINFVFNYTDPSGIGFNAAGSAGVDRRAALESAADIVENLFSNYTASIQMDVNGGETDDSTLASAGSNFNGPFGTGFGNQGDVQIKILGGADPSGGADGTVNWNFEDHTWNTTNTVPGGEFDFISTAAHELLHAVGFSSDIAQNGNDPGGNTPGNPGNWAPFDRYVADSTGSLINGTNFILDGARWNAASIGGTGTTPATNGLYFNGPNATAANGGNPVPLYSPNPWEDGSSGSHLDDNFFSGGNQLLMNSASAPGPGIRSLSGIELGMLRDIGYANVVPEPSSTLLIFVSLGGMLLRRRR